MSICPQNQRSQKQTLNMQLIGFTVDGLGRSARCLRQRWKPRLFLWRMVALPMNKADGRLHLHLLGTLVHCNGTVQNVLSREVVVHRVLRDALDHCVCSTVGCQELNGKGTVLTHSPPRLEESTNVCSHIRNRPWTHNGVGPGGIGKAQSAKASSMILITVALVSHRQAAPLKSPATTSTCSSSITARIVRISFFPIRFFFFGRQTVVGVERHRCEGFWAAERLSSKKKKKHTI